MPKTSARHILTSNEKLVKKIKKEIIEGKTTFEKAAKKFSKCSSGKRAGNLGTFNKGDMVKEFDNVIFAKDTKINKIYGPVKTQFGFHLIEVLAIYK